MMNDDEIIELLEQKKQIILQGPPGTGKTRKAKEIAEKLTKDKKYRKLIQFHPAYSYEDFVRGIVAKTDNEQIKYEVKNKILAEIAKDACENWEYTKWFEEQFGEFVRTLQTRISNERVIEITQNAQIEEIGENYFYYRYSNNHAKMYFDDIKKAFEDGTDRQDMINNQNLRKSASNEGLVSYYSRVAKNFSDFMNGREYQTNATEERIKRQNYVLIIDEINRANLPAVFGELIYALEYRGESVESIYEFKENREIILPPNLFIIGTMNTADRSVGHIDYAMRRRFAFVDVPPEEDVITNEKAKNLFLKVKELVKNNLSSDFNYNDVMIGHSYFLVNNEIELTMKLEYEIKPILREYLKDGVFLESEAVNAQVINDLDV